MTHSAIGELCVQFYYSGPKSLASYFPADFRHAVPEHAVALVITCARNFHISCPWLPDNC